MLQTLRMNSFDDDVSVLSVHSFSDDNDDNDDGLENDEQNNLPFVYETPPSWKLIQRTQVIKNEIYLHLYSECAD